MSLKQDLQKYVRKRIHRIKLEIDRADLAKDTEQVIILTAQLSEINNVAANFGVKLK